MMLVSGDSPGFQEQGAAFEAAHRDAPSADRRQPLSDDHTAHAPGQVCALCSAIIAAGEPVRLRANGWWAHEACPVRW